MKMYKRADQNEEYCKKLHPQLCMNLGPTKLQELPTFLLVDTDHIQKQMNQLENEMNYARRCMDKKKWAGRRKR